MHETLDTARQAILTGILVAFVSLGYSLVYGLLRFVNFAHGEVLAVAAYGSLYCAQLLGIHSFWLAILLGGLIGGCVAVAIEIFVYRHLRQNGPLALLLASFATSMILQASIGLLWGTRSRLFSLEIPQIQILSYNFDSSYLTIAISACITVVFLEIALRRTIWGLVIRGFSVNPAQVAALGLPIDRSVMFTFAIGGFLAGVAGVCIGNQSGVNPQIGFHFSLWAFAATVVGGLGSVRGTFLGGLLMGATLAVATRYLSVLHTDGIAFIIMTAVLIFRPKGLFVTLDRTV